MDGWSLHVSGNLPLRLMALVELDGDLSTTELLYGSPAYQDPGKTQEIGVISVTRFASNGKLVNTLSLTSLAFPNFTNSAFETGYVSSQFPSFGTAAAFTMSAAGPYLARLYANWLLTSWPNGTIPSMGCDGCDLDAALYSPLTAAAGAGILPKPDPFIVPFMPTQWTVITAPFAGEQDCLTSAGGRCRWNSVLVLSAWTAPAQLPRSSTIVTAKQLLQDSEVKMTQTQRELVTVGHSIVMLGLLDTTKGPPGSPEEAVSEAEWAKTARSGHTVVDIVMTLRRWGTAQEGGVLLARLEMQADPNIHRAVIQLARLLVSDMKLQLDAVASPMPLWDTSDRTGSSLGYSELARPYHYTGKAATGVNFTAECGNAQRLDSNSVASSVTSLIVPFVQWDRLEPLPGQANITVRAGLQPGTSIIGVLGLHTTHSNWSTCCDCDGPMNFNLTCIVQPQEEIARSPHGAHGHRVRWLRRLGCNTVSGLWISQALLQVMDAPRCGNHGPVALPRFFQVCC